VLPADFWEQHSKDMRSWKEGDRTWYQVNGPAAASWRPNLFVYESANAQGIEAMVRAVEGDSAKLELARDFRSERHSVWGITARNREQNFALNLLMDPDIDFVTLLGPGGQRQDAAGTGSRSGTDPGA
jgi:PhoH-like ATPase